ncbi:MAG TPA: hypothetical protein VKE70_26165, partial [Candidatus Solibacter sp.]|nr:hypothetical protein [Candidatus Solibacter sp.]
KVYNDHSNYAEWEFVFDYSKPKQIPNPNAQGTVGTPASQLGSNPGAPLGAPIANPTNPTNNPMTTQPPPGFGSFGSGSYPTGVGTTRKQ